jgi:hypothetical protein
MGSQKTCLDWAIDGFNVTGRPLIYTFVGDLEVSTSKPTKTGGAEFQVTAAIATYTGT